MRGPGGNVGAASSTALRGPLFFPVPPLLQPHLCNQLPAEFGTGKIPDSPQQLTLLGNRMFPFTPEQSPHQYCWVPGTRRMQLRSPAPPSPAGLPSPFDLRAQPLLGAPSCARLLLGLHISAAAPLGSLPGARTPSGFVTQTQMYP